MKPYAQNKKLQNELKFMKDYKKLQTEIENTIMTEINDKLSTLLDKKCTEKYELAQKISKEAIEGIKPVLQELNGINYKNYIRNMENFLEQGENLIDYFSIDNLSDEVAEVVKPFIQPKMDEIQDLILLAKFMNLHQASRTMFLQMQTLDKNMMYLLNQITSQTIDTYKDLIYEEFKKVSELSIKVEKTFNDAVDDYAHKKESSNNFKTPTQKIFDYKKLDKLIKDLGYQATRQTGSHKIYENEQGKSVPVPQHNIGKGLSCKIQKQVQV